MLREAKPQVESSGCFDWKVIAGRFNVICGMTNSWHLENQDSQLEWQDFVCCLSKCSTQCIFAAFVFHSPHSNRFPVSLHTLSPALSRYPHSALQ